jgi:hypothetical protein
LAETAGYSGTPLAKKLGLKDGQRLLFVGLPETLGWLAGERDFAEVVHRPDWAGIGPDDKGFDVVHAFTLHHGDIKSGLLRLQDIIKPDGMIWVSWPKKAAKLDTDVTEDVVRAEALQLDLVDVKVCAVDAVWSGLKLVIRKHLRGAARRV